jgi:hypothetical protein
MPNPKLTQEEMEVLLKGMLNEISSLKDQFLIDQDKKQEWERNAVTSEHTNSFAEKLNEIENKSEFSEYEFQNSAVVRAINNELLLLENITRQDEADIKSPRAQRLKQAHANKEIKKPLNVVTAINEFLAKISSDKAHTISKDEIEAVETQLRESKFEKKKQITLEANLRRVKALVKNSHAKLAEEGLEVKSGASRRK